MSGVSSECVRPGVTHGNAHFQRHPDAPQIRPCLTEASSPWWTGRSPRSAERWSTRRCLRICLGRHCLGSGRNLKLQPVYLVHAAATFAPIILMLDCAESLAGGLAAKSLDGVLTPGPRAVTATSVVVV
jgi:hypothetical protein